MRALRIAAFIHAIHGALVGALGLAGIVNGFRERHIPDADWQLFIAVFVVGPAFAWWTWVAARSADGPGRARWTRPRAAVAMLSVVGGVLATIGSVGYAGSGGVGAAFFVAVAMSAVWVTSVEALFVAGFFATRPARNAV